MSESRRATYADSRRRSALTLLLALVVTACAGGVVAAGDTPQEPVATGVAEVETPAVANLEPALAEALRLATRAAAADGITIELTSGWRSPEYQERLFREAVATYGSEEEASRWVARGDSSAHVSGDAVDLGPAAAVDWLARNGARYGLCQVYGNEPWHFELRPEAPREGCPAPYADPRHDPRLQ